MDGVLQTHPFRILRSMENESTATELKGETINLLQNLPTDVLLSIFDYCGYRDLVQLSFLCKRFHSIMSDENFWRRRSLYTLVTNLRGDEMKKRFHFNVRSREKVRLSYNWKTARFKEHVKLHFESKYMPWLCLGNDYLWLSKGNTILGLKRYWKGSRVYLDWRASISLRGHAEDVCRFVYRQGIIVSCGRSNSIYGFSGDGRTSKPLFHINFAHFLEVTAVDLCNQTLISGSTDKTVKVWQVNPTENGDEWTSTLLSTVDTRDSVRSVGLRPGSRECLVGTSGFNAPPILLLDIQTGVPVVEFNLKFRHGAGVLDVNWECPHTALTTGYDTYIRLWDCRTGNNELSWGDPFDSSIYCLASDNSYTMLAGTCNHGRVQLWDKRQASSIQMYFVSSKHSRRSSVYSLTFDPYNMYVALDQTLNILDFAGYASRPKDYWLGCGRSDPLIEYTS